MIMVGGMAGDSWHSNRRRKLADHIFAYSKEAEAVMEVR